MNENAVYERDYAASADHLLPRAGSDSPARLCPGLYHELSWKALSVAAGCSVIKFSSVRMKRSEVDWNNLLPISKALIFIKSYACKWRKIILLYKFSLKRILISMMSSLISSSSRRNDNCNRIFAENSCSGTGLSCSIRIQQFSWLNTTISV